MLLDTKKIAEIEADVAENGEEMIAQLDCCNSTTYRNQRNFRFLPSHKSLILSIPDAIREMDVVVKKKRRTMLEFKKLLTSTELKEMLLVRLNQNADKFGFEMGAWKEDKLSDVTTIIINNELTGKCSVQCFKCAVTINAIYKGYWVTGNIMRHIKTHRSSGDGVETIEINATETSEQLKQTAIEPLKTNDMDLNLLEQLNSGEIKH